MGNPSHKASLFRRARDVRFCNGRLAGRGIVSLVLLADAQGATLGLAEAVGKLQAIKSLGSKNARATHRLLTTAGCKYMNFLANTVPMTRYLNAMLPLVALAAAFALVRLSAALQCAGISKRVVVVAGAVALVVVTASSTFTYFDRVVVGEEEHNAWFRALVGAVLPHLGKERAIIVTPRRNEHVDVDRYLSLMAYDDLLDARVHGIPRGDLYQVTSCEEPFGAEGRKETLQPPPVLIVAADIVDYREPCTQAYLAKLTAHYPGSAVIVAKPEPPSGDLSPAPR